MARTTAAVLLMATLVAACAERHPAPVTEGKDVRLTLLHTTDIHSRLLPYDMTPLAGDRDLGLDPEEAPFGGIARMAHIIRRERQKAPRSLYVDSGDCFQGAPIFNAFMGEVEQRALSLMRPDAVVIGNHEFDEGIRNYVEQLQRWATYPVIAANYLFEPGEPLGEIAQPVEVLNVDGLKVGVIGVANFSSISSITDIGNSLNLTPLDIHQTVQDWIDILEPHVDLVVAVSHAGLGEDEEMIQHTEGLDLVMGGHLHIVLNPPKVIEDRAGRPVVLAHSGAFTKFVGRLDVVVRDGDVIAHDYEVFPIDSSVPEDPEMVNLLEPYRRKLHQLIDLNSVYGYSSKLIRRFGFDGGDSPLGNLVAEAIRQYARADFGMTNSLGIRTDINPGAITLDQLYNIFPFNNYVTTMYLSGADVQALLDFATRRSAGRGCATQIQVSGVEYVMDCSSDPPVARDIHFTDCGDPTLADKSDCERVPLDERAVYEMATNDYIAEGGSGFTVLKVNNTQIITDVALRDAVLENVIRSPRCSNQCRAEDGRLMLAGCTAYQDCVTDLAEFYTRRCRRVTQTTPGEAEVASHCPVDPGAQCFSAEDCRAGDETRTDYVCQDRRCERGCATDADCPGSDLVGEGGQSLCVGGVCRPREGAPCEDDAGCTGVEEVCSDGGCATCEVSADCEPGQLCVDGACVTPVSVCVDHRCRARCQGDADCSPGAVCTPAGHCVPAECTEPMPRGDACALFGEWKALERCLEVPCPTAESDGRIRRILPENLEDLPSDEDPDDVPI
ncbi:MAG: bifunctional metallophosphatase/5'-nucleotidase [Myxococcota bacterium]